MASKVLTASPEQPEPVYSCPDVLVSMCINHCTLEAYEEETSQEQYGHKCYVNANIDLNI